MLYNHFLLGTDILSDMFEKDSYLGKSLIQSWSTHVLERVLRKWVGGRLGGQLLPYMS